MVVTFCNVLYEFCTAVMPLRSRLELLDEVVQGLVECVYLPGVVGVRGVALADVAMDVALGSRCASSASDCSRRCERGTFASQPS